MQALVNGIERDSISIADRAVLYGDSLFETVAVRGRQALLLDLHLERLARSAKQLQIHYDHQQLLTEIQQLLGNNIIDSEQDTSVLRITLSRGAGGRGYQPSTDLEGTRIVSLHEAPQYPAHYQTEGITLGLSELRLAKQSALAGLKHGNRLEQVLASMDIAADSQDVILRDHEEHIICCSKANLFALIDDTWVTPDLSECGINGVMRTKIQALAATHKLPFATSNTMTLTDLRNAKALFISNSLIGVWPVKRLLTNGNDCFVQQYTTRDCAIIQQHLAAAGCIL